MSCVTALMRGLIGGSRCIRCILCSLLLLAFPGLQTLALEQECNSSSAAGDSSQVRGSSSHKVNRKNSTDTLCEYSFALVLFKAAFNYEMEAQASMYTHIGECRYIVARCRASPQRP